MPTRVLVEVLHAIPTQGRLIHDLPEDDTPYDSWGRISEGQLYGPPPPYTATELRQLREGGLPFGGVLNYRDVSQSDMAVCDTSLQTCRHSLHNPDNAIITKVFSTMSELKLFLQDYAMYHHRPYYVTHSNRELRYHVRCKTGGRLFVCGG
jgi:hypothetical protein